MAPTRIGFIGLSAAGWGPSAHLPYLQVSDKYEIVAVCNSSVESAQHAIELYKLPSSTKAYGDPNELAKDETVDLVVCSVRVDRHLLVIGPSLKAGKDVYVEWPLGKNLQDAKELLRLKNEGNVKFANVGLQARQSPMVKRLRNLIEEGKIGKVFSSTWVGQATNGGETVSEDLEYIGRKEVGGNLLTIHFGHSVDYIQQVLGSNFESSGSLLANQRHFVTLVKGDGAVISSHHPKTADDHIFVHGKLAKSGVVVSITLRGGKPFKGTPGLVWTIYGEKGEIRVTSSGPFLQIGYPDLAVSIHDFAKDEVTEVEIPEDLEALPLPARNIARVYELQAEGVVNCSFEDAVERHAFLDKVDKESL